MATVAATDQKEEEEKKTNRKTTNNNNCKQHQQQQVRNRRRRQPQRRETAFRVAVFTTTIMMISMVSVMKARARSTVRTSGGVMAFTTTTTTTSPSSSVVPRTRYHLSPRVSQSSTLLSNLQQQKASLFGLSLHTSPHHQSFSRCLFSSSSNNVGEDEANDNDNDNDDDEDDDDGFFADTDVTFESIGVRSQVLLERLEKNLGMTRPTQIQAKAFQPILRDPASSNDDTSDVQQQQQEQQSSLSTPRRRLSRDVTIGAETGCGKTLAYLLPLMDDILYEKEQTKENKPTGDSKVPILPTYDYARAIILVPNKELVQQVLRMAVPLCGGTIQEALVWGASGTELLEQLKPIACSTQPGETDPSQMVRMAIMPGGLNEPLDFKPFRESIALGGKDPPVDLVVTTPAALGDLGLKPKHIDMFADIRTLVIDEADMLLDGGYIRALENVLVGFKRADRLDPPVLIQKKESSDDDGDSSKSAAIIPINTKTQHIFCAATLPDVGLKSVDAYLQRKFPYATRIETDNMHNAKHYGLVAPTQWYQVETKKERLGRLVDMLTGADGASDDLRNEKVMVFLNSVEDVEAVHEALAQRGVKNVPYHAKISLLDRSRNLDRFRRYQPGDETDDTVPVLVCTDLASRGLDVPGVTAVVQLQFSGNVVSHLHRMGRCGRAGARTGRGIVFYGDTEEELVLVVQEAESQQERMQLQQDVDDIEVPVDGAEEKRGKVKDAFSRKRGFTKKRKKLRRQEGGGVMGY